MSYAALPLLRTPRLTLRPLHITDADAIADGVGNYDVSRWLGAVPYPYDVDDARDYIAVVQDQAQPVWAIEAAGALIGTVSTHERLGYWLARPAWRKGYGFEACVGVVDHWFARADASDLEAGFFQGNERSKAVMRALGFRLLGHGTTFAKSLNQDVPSTDMVLTRKAWERRQNFTLYTPRLTLRPMEGRDAAAFAALTVPEITRNLSRLNTGMTTDDVLADLPRRTWRGYLGFTLVIEHQGKFAGTIGIGGGGIGYFLDPELWGQGIMTEALSAVVPEIFDRFPISRIKADHFVDNPASGAVLRKQGFEETGEEMGTSMARVEPAPLITYALTRDNLKDRT